MLKQLRVQRFKSLFDVTVNFEPLTVFIGPNGSGKSNICEALFTFSNLLQTNHLQNAIKQTSQANDWQAKYWHRQIDEMQCILKFDNDGQVLKHTFTVKQGKLIDPNIDKILTNIFSKVVIYDFTPTLIALPTGATDLRSTGQGIAQLLTNMLLDNRQRFDELEQRFIQLIPNVSHISLARENNQDSLRIVDKYSEQHIPAADISDGTLRILAFLTALYQPQTPNIICFEEPENGIHPWLLNKMVELLNLVSTEGITGNPVQILITTHSPLLLNYVKPEQVRAVELDSEGKTQVHALPTETARFQAALEAYDHELGELWFTDLFGANPE